MVLYLRILALCQIPNVVQCGNPSSVWASGWPAGGAQGEHVSQSPLGEQLLLFYTGPWLHQPLSEPSV